MMGPPAGGEGRGGLNPRRGRLLTRRRFLYRPAVAPGTATYQCEKQNHRLDRAIDHKLIAKAKPALARKKPVTIEMPIRNVHRVVGAMLSGEVAKRYGDEGMPDGSIHVRFKGTAGQSFRAFLARGLTLELEGAPHDYCRKGPSRRRLGVFPAHYHPPQREQSLLVGHTGVYRALSGGWILRGVG